MPWQHTRGVEVGLCAFITSAPCEANDQVHGSTPLSWGKKSLMGGPQRWSGHGGKEKSPTPCGNQTPVVQHEPSSFLVRGDYSGGSPKFGFTSKVEAGSYAGSEESF